MIAKPPRKVHRDYGSSTCAVETQFVRASATRRYATSGRFVGKVAETSSPEISAGDAAHFRFCQFPVSAVKFSSAFVAVTFDSTVVEAVPPTYARHRRVRPAARFSRTPPDPSAPAALYAEHGDSILAELGYDREERERLRARGVLA